MTQPPHTPGTVTPAETRSGLLAWRNAVFAIFFVSGLTLATWMSRIPAVRDGLDLTTAQVGLVIFGLSGGSVLGLIAAVGLLARLGTRRAMTLSVGVSTVGLITAGVGASLIPTAGLVFAGLALMGFGMGALDVMMNVEGAAAERAVGKTLMPLMHACFSLGTVIGALIGAGASFVELPVFWHLAVIAVLVLVTAVAAVRTIPQREHDAEPETDAPGAATSSASVAGNWRERLRANLAVWGDVTVLLIGVIVLGMTFAEGSANDWLALAAVDGHAMSNTEGAIVFGVFVTAMTVGRVFGGPVLDRFGRVPVLRVCAVLGVVGLLLFILAPNQPVLYTGTVLWGLGASLGFPVGMSAAADDTRNAAARVSAVAMIGYFAFLVGPPVLGLLGESWGILNALYLILVLMILAGLAAPAARERGTARAGRG
ncbi:MULTISPECIES: MFS transporter [Cryobacterium]|uniref:MFS transporter n=1 Tax=Cryobacterium breve TaxID=1259258 RepID=A0ABY2IXQ2_9MICO|nr:MULTISPECIES: MFS transporter [Cryobacterium]TFC93120.1 MFS transporter [Cryobacterium sp. TmT3-12]TFC96105.1 MFS transporter [Cryobacterium breve]